MTDEEKAMLHAEVETLNVHELRASVVLQRLEIERLRSAQEDIGTIYIRDGEQYRAQLRFPIPDGAYRKALTKVVRDPGEVTDAEESLRKIVSNITSIEEDCDTQGRQRGNAAPLPRLPTRRIAARMAGRTVRREGAGK